MATEVIVFSVEEEASSGVTALEENPDEVFMAAGSTAFGEGSNTFKRPKLEDVSISSDSADEEDHHTSLQPRTVTSNVGPALYKHKWHTFKEESTFFKDSVRIAKALLFPSAQVNNSVPVGCDQELCFLIDTSQLRFTEDITCDETGKYQKPSRAKCKITVDKDGNVGSSDHLGNHRTYTFVRKYYKHKDTPNFQRTLYELHAEEGIMHAICMIRYEWRGEKTELIISPHGNQKHSERPYIRSKKELLRELKTSHCSSAQKVVDGYYEKEGGSDLQSFAAVPRDRRQVYRHGSLKANSSDLYTDKQAEDMRRNVCRNGKVLVLDSTFDCDPMYLTIASHRHDHFVNRSNDRNTDEVFMAAGSTAFGEGSNTFKRPKLEDVSISSDSADEEDHYTPLQPRTVTSNVGPALYKHKWHTFKEESTFFKDSERIAKALLFPSAQVNNSVPVGCDQELCFLIDTSQLRFIEDITCDETGKYQKPSRAKCKITVDKDGNVGSSDHLGNHRTYTFVRKYYKHRDTPNFQRTLYELHAEEGIMHAICMIRYEWRGEKTELIISPHGNQKHSERPYIRSKKELLRELKTSHCSSAQKVVDGYYEKEGGSDLQSFAAVPRDRRQVYRHGSLKANSSDFSELLKMNLKGDFVKSVEFCHEKGSGSMPRCVLYTDKQAEDMRRNVCRNGKVLVFDSTFDCGPMYLTIASYQHDHFVNRSNDRSVLMPGAILIHGRRDFESYRYFGNELSKGLQHTSVPFYGTDGEIALEKGIAATSSFKDSSHLHCMLHHKKNCETKLAKLGVRRNARIIVRSIYGEQLDSTRYEGLADYNLEEEYELQLAIWAPQWDALETEETGREAEFSTWFRRFKSADVKTSMLKPLRSRAGLGDPPRQFTINDAESINAMVSKWIAGKKGWDKLAKSLQEFVRSKYRELEMAVLGMGERKLDHQYKRLQKTAVEWRNMSKEEHREILQQAHVKPEVHTELSIGPDESSVCGFTSDQLQDVWHKAGLILQSPGNIVSAPNNPKITVCFSETSTVTVTQKEDMAKFVCEEKCKSFNFHERLFCEHCLAVAEHRGVLADFLVTINARKRASTVSLVNEALQKQCSGSGKKQATKRRGGNNSVGCQVKNVVRMPQTHQPFTVARNVGLISRCYGCKQKFGEQMNVPPRDLILRKLDFREWMDKNSGEMRRSQSLVPTYYHLKMDCVRIRYPITEVKDILLYEEVKEQLCEEHLTELRHFGLTFH